MPTRRQQVLIPEPLAGERRVLISEMSIRAGVTTALLRALAERGEVPAVRCGKFWSFSLADLGVVRAAATAAGHPPIVASTAAGATA
ncbi:hypothetical protein [Urbifossiella limnaea]|uniref:Helix-turn-helix domain-containing protein n=1 Tax=Urbifossiella limnaea TaxID=2528023 RepID=A0A517Y1H7_9BACT|nr:hypothetical protein [Urbifossiella limnaea]QDU23610.1 hypothetical protein ETAA1_56140 [Urbifossiella limnaea]